MDAALDVAMSIKKMIPGRRKSEMDALREKMKSGSDDPLSPDSSANLTKLLEIQNYFIDGENLVVPGRVFVREGTLVKMCRKSPKARYFVLFNDCLLYGTIIKDKTAARRVVCAKPVLLPLGSMTVTPLTDEQYQHGFQISTPTKSFQVFASSDAEREVWLDSMASFANYSNENPEFAAAVWVPDYKVTNCMVCEFTRFSAFVRRHHCRKCGKVVCNGCSSQRRPLAGGTEAVRVCDLCAGMPVRAAANSSATKDDKDGGSESDDSGEEENTSEVKGADGRVAFSVQEGTFPVPAPKPMMRRQPGSSPAVAAASASSPTPSPAPEESGAVNVTGAAAPRRRQFKKADDGENSPTPVESPVAETPIVPPRPSMAAITSQTASLSVTPDATEEAPTPVPAVRPRRQFKAATEDADQ